MEHEPTPPLDQMSSSSSEDKSDDEDASIDSSDEEMEEEAEEETEEDKQSTKLSLYHAQNYFNSTMGGKDFDRIPSTTPGAEPPRDDRDSGSARSHSTHLETSSSDRPKMVTYTEPQTVSSYMSVECTRRTLRMPIFTRATHAQPSLSNFTRRDSDFWRAGTLTRDDPGGTKFSHFPPK